MQIIPNSNGEDNRPLREYAKSGNPYHDKVGRFSSGPGSGDKTSDYPVLAGRERAADTQLRHSDGHGHYTPERAALHAEIIRHFLQGTTAVTHPVATMLGGGPASGKSTVVKKTKLGQTNTVHVNTDEIRAFLPEYKDSVKKKDPNGARFTHEEASDIGKALTHIAAVGSRNILLDGTGDSSILTLAAKVEALRRTGHTVNGVYVTLPTDLAMKLMNARGARTGRFVPEKVLRDTHAAVSRTLPAAMEQGLFDSASLHDGTVKGGAVLVATSTKGKGTRIRNQKLWGTFVAKGHENAGT